MKILLVANYIHSGGGFSGQVKLLYNHLNQEGIKADIYSTKATLIKRIWMFIDLVKVAAKYDVIYVHCCSTNHFIPNHKSNIM